MAAVALPLAAVAVAAVLGARPAQASCAPVMRFGGVIYEAAAPAARTPATVRTAGHGVVPGCSDVVVNGTPVKEPDVAVTVMRLRGVDPRIAVGVEGHAVPYLAPGFVLQSAAHPLRPAARRHPAGCSRRWTLRGTVSVAPPRALTVRTGTRARRVTVLQTTTFTRLGRLGIPFVATGTKVLAVVRTCPSGQVVARAIRRAL